MKNLLKKISLTVIACFIGTFLFAQQQKTFNAEQVEKKANEKFAVLKQKLNLNEEQAQSVKDLTLTIAYKSAQGEQPQVELDNYYSYEMSKILSPDQMDKFLAMNPGLAAKSKEGKEPKAARTKTKTTAK